MLRRSFAEFHAQRALAGRRVALVAAEAALSRVRALAAEAEAEDAPAWAAARAAADASRAAAAAAAAVSAAALASRGAAAAATPGRVLLAMLPPPAELQAAAVLLRMCAAPAAAASAAASAPATGELGGASNAKVYVCLVPWRGPPPGGAAASSAAAASASSSAGAEAAPAAAAPPAMRVLGRKGDDDGGMFALSSSRKGGGGGGGSGLDAAVSTSSRLPPGLPLAGEAGGMRYAILALPADRVLALTRAKLPPGALDADALLDRRDAAATARAAAALTALVAAPDADAQLTPLDPIKDLRMNDVAAVDAYRSLQARVAALPPPSASASSSASRAAEWAALAGVLGRASSAVASARHATSDAVLERMPDYHARVGVLQQLGYLDADKTVTLKGRVACEINTSVRAVNRARVLMCP
jgi:antiviral helicase SKI2